MKNNKVIYIIISVIAVALIVLGIVLYTNNSKKPSNTPDNNTNNPVDNNKEKPVDNTGDNNNSGETGDNTQDEDETPSQFSDGYKLPKDALKSMELGRSCVADHDVSKMQKICFDSLNGVTTETIEDYNVMQANDTVELFAMNYELRVGRTQMFEDDVEEFKGKGLTKSSNKITSEEKNGYTIETYHYVYYNNFNASSVLYIFISNSKNNVLVKYKLNGKTLSEALSKKLIDDISFEESSNVPTKTEKIGNQLEVSLEQAAFYKRNNGSLVDRDINDQDKVYTLSYSISGSDFDEAANGNGQKNTVTFSKRSGEYTLNILLGNGKYLSLDDIVKANNKSYSIISTNKNYTVGGKTVLKQEYTYNGYKYLEYYFLNDDGFYIRYQFAANSDYTYNYGEVENLLKFNV